MKKFKALALIVALALVAQGLVAAPAVRAQDKVFKIISHSPLSGGQSQLGIAIRNGTELAVKQLSKPITDLGFTVQFAAFDDQATPDVGVSNAKQFINDPTILAVVGHLNSGVAIPSSEVYKQVDLVMVSPANTNVAVTDRGLSNVNRVCGRDDAQGAAGAGYAVDELKAKTAYVIHDKTAYGEGVATSFRDAAQKAGIEIIGFEGTTETSNFDAVITPIVAANPDVVYFGGIYNQAAVFFKQSREKGLKSQFMGPDGMDASDNVKIGGDAVVGLIYTTTAGPASTFPLAKQFIEDYKNEYKINPEPYAVESYASAQIILKAIEGLIKSNGGKLPTRAEVSAAVRATKDLDTIKGKISFDGNGDPTEATYYILQVGSNDPAKWGDNKLLKQTIAPSPLAAKAGSMEATPEATAAK